MKTLHSVAIVAALGMSLLVGCSDPDASAGDSDAPATKESVGAKFEYVADMTGIT